MADNKEETHKNPFQKTLNLPHTEFSIRAHASVKEKELISRWEQEQVSMKAQGLHKDAERFVLHDGPPYANGHIHLGHAFNKILKDMVCKSHRMGGKYVPYVPGWDCHGLPIELKVTTELGIEDKKVENKGITTQERDQRIAFKKQCRDYASKWIKTQAEEFKDLGVLADWENYYSTMSPAYESFIIEAFATFVEKGFITRKGKTVSWCASCQTVLASAEIEYKDRKDPSTYILFPLSSKTSYEVFPFLIEHNRDLEINFLIWTTTPWTIPLNRAVVLHPTAPYVVLQGKEQHQAFIVAKDLADKICQLIGIEKIELAEFDPIVFQGKRVQHPFVEGLQVPVILDDSVQLSDGTACVHSAPGCGPEDYVLGIKNGLEIFSPLSADGKYIKGILPAELEGMSISDGQIWVMRKLKEVNRLFFKASINHSYPHCWRCRNGLMFRATDQWFCDLQQQNLATQTLKEIETTQFIPEWGKVRLHSFVQNRSEWCISRQRQWGVPIPAILCNACDWTYLDATFIRHIATHIANEGIEYWDRITVYDLKKAGILPAHFACNTCGNTDEDNFRQERDILDVWFDSGVSHYAVLAQDDRLSVPADLYLEGSDQHRGWFQSSLLCSMVLNGTSQAKAVMTHGFLVDEYKHKMSKSVGNVVAPQDIITTYSRDILRLWVASTDFSGDVVISERLLKNVAEVYRKIRNTCRFMISNLYDFDVKKDSVELKDMLAIDRYILGQLKDLRGRVLQAYREYHFAGVAQLINNFCNNNLSAGYLDILKDRLYVEKADGKLRRSGQTALYYILDVVTHLMAPILSFLAEEVSDYYLVDKKESIHLQQHPSSAFLDGSSITSSTAWNLLEQMRNVVLKAIEEQRQAGIVKHSLEAKVLLHINYADQEAAPLIGFLEEAKQREDYVRFFKDWFIVSQVEFTDAIVELEATELSWLHVRAEHASGSKCPRCWQWNESTLPAQVKVHCEYHKEERTAEMSIRCTCIADHELLCNRCKDIVT